MLKFISSVAIALLLSACAYKTGVEVTQETLNKVQVHKTTKSQVESIVGYPTRKQTLGKNEIWYYDFTSISHNPFGGNIDEATVIEFNTKGVVTKKYKTKSAGENPLLK